MNYIRSILAPWAVCLIVFAMGEARASGVRPAGFAVVNEAMPAAVFDMRYYTGDNFLGVRVDGYGKPLCILTRQALRALREVRRDVNAEGFELKIFDCYRPQRAVDHFVRWVNDPGDQKTKPRYYPNQDKSRLVEKGYIADKSGHSRGSTVDLTLVAASDGRELDMGTPFDYFDTLSNTLDPRITGRPARNRALLKAAMERRGFVNYDKEWWHYTLADEPFPDTYFDFPIE